MCISVCLIWVMTFKWVFIETLSLACWLVHLDHIFVKSEYQGQLWNQYQVVDRTLGILAPGHQFICSYKYKPQVKIINQVKVIPRSSVWLSLPLSIQPTKPLYSGSLFQNTNNKVAATSSYLITFPFLQLSWYW